MGPLLNRSLPPLSASENMKSQQALLGRLLAVEVSLRSILMGRHYLPKRNLVRLCEKTLLCYSTAFVTQRLLNVRVESRRGVYTIICFIRCISWGFFGEFDYCGSMSLVSLIIHPLYLLVSLGPYVEYV